MWIAERPGLAPGTTALYEGLLRLHVEPTLGAVDLVELNPARVRAWRKDLLESGVGETTVAKCYRLLRSVLNTAVDDELIRRNPCRIKGAGAEKSGERPVPTPEQVLALAAAMPARWRALVLLAAATSPRWGELMALTGADVDLENGMARVVNAVSEVNGMHLLAVPPTRPRARLDDRRRRGPHPACQPVPGARRRPGAGRRAAGAHRSRGPRPDRRRAGARRDARRGSSRQRSDAGLASRAELGTTLYVRVRPKTDAPQEDDEAPLFPA